MSELQLDVLNSSIKATLKCEALSISGIKPSAKRFSQYTLDQSESSRVNTVNEYWLSCPTQNIFIDMEFIVFIKFLVTQFSYASDCFSRELTGKLLLMSKLNQHY